MVAGSYPAELDVVKLDTDAAAGRIGRIRNEAIEHARYENIAILDGDTVLGRGWYRGLKQHTESFDILTSEVRLPDGSLDCAPSFGGRAWLVKRHVAKAVRWDEAESYGEREELDFAQHCLRNGFQITHHPPCVAFRMDESLTQVGHGNHRRSMVNSQGWVIQELPGRSEAEIMDRASLHIEAQRIAEAADCIRFGLELYPKSEALASAWARLQDIFGGALTRSRWFSFGDPEYRAAMQILAPFNASGASQG